MRTVLHSDLNNFYASVECCKNPEIRNKPVVVIGSKEDRHGIVLAKNMIAKSLGVKTGDVYWEAKRKCGETLVEVKVDFPTYVAVSKEVKKIYAEYTDKIESYGIDECWLDVTDCEKRFGGGYNLAELIRKRVKDELGLTVSIGVSWNKIFAKLGSDMKKPDAVTEITLQNYKQKVWTLPVQELLYVGKATQRKLNSVGIKTIGDLARTDVNRLYKMLGKWGCYLHTYANGNDDSPVAALDDEKDVKSIGNSLTVYRDLKSSAEVEPVIWLLADSVSSRMREAGFTKARTVHVYARSNELKGYAKQGKLSVPSCNMKDIATLAFSLFNEVYPWVNDVRALGVTVSDFDVGDEQLSLFSGGETEQKQTRLNAAIDNIRKKYGNKVIQPATVFTDPRLRELDIKGEHIIHPDGNANKKDKK